MNVSVINNVPQELLIADTYKYKASIRRYIEYYILGNLVSWYSEIPGRSRGIQKYQVVLGI